MSNDMPVSSAMTPEKYFTPKPNPEKEVPIDALLCALSRAGAILTLLMHDSDVTADATVHDTLWCVRGILDQATVMVEHSIGIGEVTK